MFWNVIHKFSVDILTKITTYLVIFVFPRCRYKNGCFSNWHTTPFKDILKDLAEDFVLIALKALLYHITCPLRFATTDSSFSATSSFDIPPVRDNSKYGIPAVCHSRPQKPESRLHFWVFSSSLSKDDEKSFIKVLMLTYS